MNEPQNPNYGDLIAAIATPAGKGGVGIVRLSGSNLDKIEKSILNKKAKAKQICYRSFVADDGTVIDEGIALRFIGPASFTGEDLLELQGHGGNAVMKLLLDRCIELGARIAEPGEFSMRAFSNGKIDLAQAEGIADLVNATSKRAAKLASASARGELGRKTKIIAEELTAIRCEIEASIDFSEDDINPQELAKLTLRIDKTCSELQSLLEECNRGVAISQNSTIALVGKPNVGKSSLLNLLCKKDAAIINDKPGTTRDIVRAHCEIAGVEVTLLDTAGIRDGGEKVEQEGMRRAKLAANDAELVILVQDANEKNDLELASDLVVENKIDLSDKEPFAKDNLIGMSAKTGAGLEYLYTALEQRLGITGAEPSFLARTRHVDTLTQTLQELQLARQTKAVYAEQVAEYLRLAHDSLGTITGKLQADDLLGEIFSKFCIGK